MLYVVHRCRNLSQESFSTSEVHEPLDKFIVAVTFQWAFHSVGYPHESITYHTKGVKRLSIDPTQFVNCNPPTQLKGNLASVLTQV